MSSITIIVAMTPDGVIGNEGGLPWSIPSDLARFRTLTIGKTVVMGRKTFESVIERNGKALPNRKNVVLSKSPGSTISQHGGVQARSI